MGCTPDGKVVDCSLDSNEEKFGLLEIKCPSSKFEVTPANACSDDKFCLKMQDNVPTLKKDHDYDQVQGQMGLTGAKWCDFVVYTKAGMNIERVEFNQEHWQQLREKLCLIYFNHFLPMADGLNIN